MNKLLAIFISLVVAAITFVICYNIYAIYCTCFDTCSIVLKNVSMIGSTPLALLVGWIVYKRLTRNKL